MVQLVDIGITTLAGWLVDRYGLIRINIVGTVAMLATCLPAIAIGLNGSPMTLLLALSLATPALIPLTLIYGGHKDGQILHILEGDGVGGRRLRICWERSRCRPKALTPPRAVRRR